MATRDDVRRIALALPAVEETDERFGFAVTHRDTRKAFVWAWMERVHPKQPRVPHASIVAVRVPNVAQRDLMIDAEPAKFFTEPHYNGFPAVLVRLDAVSVGDLESLIPAAWRCQAPKSLLRQRSSF